VLCLDLCLILEASPFQTPQWLLVHIIGRTLSTIFKLVLGGIYTSQLGLKSVDTERLWAFLPYPLY